MLTLDYALVTYGPDGMNRVAAMLLPPQEGVRYVVSWQAHGDAPVPDAAMRPDVSVCRTDSVGISLNRNNALDHCSADVIVFADDDLTLYADAIAHVRDVFTRFPSLDVATFRSDHGDMSRFPDIAERLGQRLPKGYSVASFEIALRRSSAGNLRCCPELGLGSPHLHGGEDEMFLLTAINSGLDCRFFPLTICAHPHDSTGTKSNPSPQNLMAAGCVIAFMYPRAAALRIPLKAWRMWRSGQAPLFRALRYMLRGALMAPGVRRRNRASLRI